MGGDKASFLQEGRVVLQRVPGRRREVSDGESASPCGGVARVLDELVPRCSPPATGRCKHGDVPRGIWPCKFLGLLGDDQAAPLTFGKVDQPSLRSMLPKQQKDVVFCSESEQREKKIKKLQIFATSPIFSQGRGGIAPKRFLPCGKHAAAVLGSTSLSPSTADPPVGAAWEECGQEWPDLAPGEPA